MPALMEPPQAKVTALTDEIRELTEADYPAVADLTQECFDRTTPPGALVAEKWIETLHLLVKCKIAVYLGAWRGDNLVGAFCAAVVPDPLNHELIASQMFWYVRAADRGSPLGGRLLDEIEERTRAMGANRLHTMQLRSSKASKMHSFLKRKGYQPLELHYYKHLNKEQ